MLFITYLKARPEQTDGRKDGRAGKTRNMVYYDSGRPRNKLHDDH